MRARLLLAVVCTCLSAPLARAVTIDDFPAAYPGGGVFSDLGGSGQLVEPGIPVLGGTRDTRVSATNPGSPTGVSIIDNPSPPPMKKVLEGVVGGGGGTVRLGYPGLSGYDITLSNAGTFASTVEVLSSLMVAGGSIELTLTDSGGVSATESLSTHDFAGNSSSGLTKYAFFPSAQSFPGVDLTSIDELAMRLVRPDGADFELSELRLLAVSPGSADWSSGFALEPAGGAAGPHLLIGFLPQSKPPGIRAELDLSNPALPRISWPGGVEPVPLLELLVATYGGLGINPCTSPNAGFEFELHQGSDVYRVHFEAMSTTGEVLDPASIVGFNPQPEPPGKDLFGWTNPPDASPPQAFGAGFSLQAPMAMMAAPVPAAETEGVSLTIEILDPQGDPIPLAQALVTSDIPALPPWAAPALAALLLAAVLALARRMRAV
jgi:hypothetical protein